MSNPSANPILRRLSAAGSTEEDISMGAVTGNPQQVEDELIKLHAKIYIKETGYLRLDLSFAASGSGRKTSKQDPCTSCGDDTGKASRFTRRDNQRHCVDCWNKDFRPLCCVPCSDEAAFLEGVNREGFYPTKVEVAQGLIVKLNNMTDGKSGVTDSREVIKLAAVKADAMKTLRSANGISSDGFSIPNIGTTDWVSLTGQIESAHAFVPLLYDHRKTKVDVSAMYSSVIMLASLVTKSYISDFIRFLKY